MNADILKDPTATLREATADHVSEWRAGHLLMALHLHILAGGPLPEQWRGEGTAVGGLIVDARECAGTTFAIRAVTGEG